MTKTKGIPISGPRWGQGTAPRLSPLCALRLVSHSLVTALFLFKALPLSTAALLCLLSFSSCFSPSYSSSSSSSYPRTSALFPRGFCSHPPPPPSTRAPCSHARFRRHSLRENLCAPQLSPPKHDLWQIYLVLPFHIGLPSVYQ